MMTSWITATEAEIAAECDKRLEKAGWRIIKTSVDRMTRRHLRGLPDRICFRDDHTLLVEYKSATGKVRDSQVSFLLAIREHVGEHLHYIIVAHPQQLDEWL